MHLIKNPYTAALIKLTISITQIGANIHFELVGFEILIDLHAAEVSLVKWRSGLTFRT